MASIVLFGYQHGTRQEFLSNIAALIHRLQQYQLLTSKVLSSAKAQQLPRIDGKRTSHTNRVINSIELPSSLVIKVFVVIKNHHNSE